MSWRFFLEQVEKERRFRDGLVAVREADFDRLTDLYACSILTEETLDAVLACGPLLDFGAGNAWIEYQLRARAAERGLTTDVLSVDSRPWRRQWRTVHLASGDEPAKQKDRALFLGWPDPEEDSVGAAKAVEQYALAGGRSLIYVGETEEVTGIPDTPWTAGPRFWEAVRKNFPSPPRIIPLSVHWGFIQSGHLFPARDSLFIWNR